MNKVRLPYIIEADDFGREVVWLVDQINAVLSTWTRQGYIACTHEYDVILRDMCTAAGVPARAIKSLGGAL